MDAEQEPKLFKAHPLSRAIGPNWAINRDHGDLLHYTQLIRQVGLRPVLTTGRKSRWIKLRMTHHPKIHARKTPVRLHFIPEWAEKRRKKQADIVAETGADKSTVSRWFSGTIPTEDYLLPLAGCLGAEEISDLFRHPDDDWLARFFRGRDEVEKERIKATLEAAFPRRTGTER